MGSRKMGNPVQREADETTSIIKQSYVKMTVVHPLQEGSGWGTQVYLWWIHFDIWKN